MQPARVILFVVSLAVLAHPALVAVPESLKTEFTIESRLLDRDITEYGTARSRQREAVARLQRIGNDLDATLTDPNASLDALRGLEGDFSVALESACARARETGEIRKRLYQRMSRLAELAREIERQRGRGLIDLDTPLDGLWQIESQPIDVYGLMNLKQDGTLVSGTYRMSNGNQGSVRGTFSGDRLRLEVIEAELGKVGEIEGSLDIEAGEISGRWQAMDLTGGRPAAGRWSATKVSSEDELDFQP